MSNKVILVQRYTRNGKLKTFKDLWKGKSYCSNFASSIRQEMSAVFFKAFIIQITKSLKYTIPGSKMI